MSKESITKLNKKFSNYTLSAEVAGQNKAGQFLGKAFIQVFDPKYEAGKQPTILKSVSCYGIGTDEKSAQENAVDVAIENLGL